MSRSSLYIKVTRSQEQKACLSVCSGLNFECLDLECLFLMCMYVLGISKVRISASSGQGQGHRSKKRVLSGLEKQKQPKFLKKKLVGF